MPTNPIKVSVIVPVHNTEQYLAECLDSIINQSLKEIEIICVENNSVDGSFAVLQEYEKKDGRIKIFEHKTGGLSGARNRGLRESRGEYIAFVDSDDIISEYFLENLYKSAVQKEPVDIVITKNVIPFVLMDDGRYAYHKPVINSPEIQRVVLRNMEEKLEANLGVYEYTVWCKIFKRSFLLNNHLFFVEDKNIEDAAFSALAVLYAETLTVAPQVAGGYYFYRQHLKSIMGSINFNPMAPYDIFMTYLAAPYHKQKALSYNEKERALLYLFMYFSCYGTTNYYFSKTKIFLWKPSYWLELIKALCTERTMWTTISTASKQIENLNNAPKIRKIYCIAKRKNKNKYLFFLKRLRTIFTYKKYRKLTGALKQIATEQEFSLFKKDIVKK